MMVLVLAWRNLWRNKRRTLLASSSVFFAVLLSLCMRSLQIGTYDYMVANSVSLYTGYLQVQGKGYWENRSIDESIVPDTALVTALRDLPGVTVVIPRLESVVLIAHGMETRVTPVSGIAPVLENSMTGLARRLVSGSYLTDSSRGIILAEGLAERLRVAVGDSVVLFGQGYQGVTAADRMRIEGIVRLPVPQLNNAATFIALPTAQQVFNADGRITALVLMVNSIDAVTTVQAAVEKRINGSGQVVLNWKEMTPELVQSIEADNASGMIMLGILYVVIGFGVFGTVMMMVIERTREFGLLIALGMKRSRLFVVTAWEALFIAMIGAVAGMAGAFPIVAYFHAHPVHVTGELAKAYLAWGIEPVLPVGLEGSVFVSQTLIVLIIALATSLYPLSVIRNIHTVSALQGRGGRR